MKSYPAAKTVCRVKIIIANVSMPLLLGICVLLQAAL
jgi:hypothetical protein